MNIAEQLANLSALAVVIIIVILVGLRYALVKQGSPAARSIAEIAESLAIAMGLVFLIIRPFFVQAFFIPSESMEPTLIGNEQIRDHILVNKAVYLVRDPRRGDIVVFNAPPEATQNTTPLADGETKQTAFIKRCIGVPGDQIYTTPGYVVANGMKRMRADIFPQSNDNHFKIVNDGITFNGKRLSNEELAKMFGTNDLEFHPGQVFVNGKALDEPYTAEDPNFSYPTFEPNDPSETKGKDYLELAIKRNKLKQVWVGDHEEIKLMPGEFMMMGDNRNHSWDSRYWGPVDRDRVIGRPLFIFWPFSRVRWVR